MQLTSIRINIADFFVFVQYIITKYRTSLYKVVFCSIYITSHLQHIMKYQTGYPKIKKITCLLVHSTQNAELLLKILHDILIVNQC